MQEVLKKLINFFHLSSASPDILFFKITPSGNNFFFYEFSFSFFEEVIIKLLNLYWYYNIGCKNYVGEDALSLKMENGTLLAVMFFITEH